MRGWAAALFAFALLTVFLVVGVFSYSVAVRQSIVTSEKNVYAGLDDVIATYDAKLQVVQTILDYLDAAPLYNERYASRSDAVKTAIAQRNAFNASSSIIDKPATYRDYIELEFAVGDALTTAINRANRIADIAYDSEFLQLRRDLGGAERRVEQAIDDLNERIERFNTITKRFPSNIIAVGIQGKFAKPLFRRESVEEL